MTRFKNRKLKDRVLEGTPVTIEWIIKHLREGSIEWQQQYEKCTIKDIETKDVSEGKGFVSKIFRIHFEFCENDVQPYDVVAKIPISSKLTELLEDRSTESDNLKEQTVTEMHNLECQFYKYHHIKNLRIPKVFFCRKFDENKTKQGAIIMEYQANAVSLPLHQSYSLAQLRALAEQIALLQAYSLSISPESIPNSSFLEKKVDVLSDMLSKGCTTFPEKNPELIESYQKMKPLFTSKYLLKRLSCDLSHYFGTSRVLAHSDLWNNNVMWKPNDDGSCSDKLLCILDWQTVHFGTPGEDFGKILMVGSDPDIRHNAEETLFDFYYEILTKKAAEQNLAVPFKVEEVIKSYQCLTVLEALGLTFFLANMNTLYKTSNSEEQTKMWNILSHRVLIALQDAYKNAIRNNMFEWPQEEMQ